MSGDGFQLPLAKAAKGSVYDTDDIEAAAHVLHLAQQELRHHTRQSKARRS